MPKHILVWTFVLTAALNFGVLEVVGQSDFGNSDQQLAAYYLTEGEYDKAVLYYEKLYQKSPNQFYYEQLLDGYMHLEEFKKSEKLIKKHLKRFPDKSTAYVDLGLLYKAMSRESDAKEAFELAIKSLRPDQNQVRDLSTAFSTAGVPDFALKTLVKGRKMLKSIYPLNFEFADLYATQNKYEDMIREYLDILKVNEGYQNQVQSRLARHLDFTESSEQLTVLKTQLIKRVQRNEGAIYSEMLIWLYLQQGQFQTAYIQAKAIDKRNNEDGGRIIAIARTAHNNGEYNLAIEGYKYVLEKGKGFFYYSMAKAEMLEVMRDKVTNGEFVPDELVVLEQSYETTLKELGKSDQTVNIMRDLAHLRAYYMQKTEEGIATLQEALQLPRISAHDQARVKLDLADILVIKGDIWDASLYYMQVDSDFKYDELGEQAKFKNALVAYYTGDFMWAQAQLDVLKGSASKLIANDAMELSLRITDNSTIDTSTVPLHLFAQAELLVLQNQFIQSRILLDSLIKTYPSHSLADDILFLKYEMEAVRKDWNQAATYLEQIIKFHPFDILADNAIFAVADIYEHQLHKTAEAKKYYEMLLFDFPGSLYVVEARKRARKLRGDQIN